MLRRILGLCAVFLLLATPPVRAADGDEEEIDFGYDRSGFYIGFAAILGVDNFEDEYEKDNGVKHQAVHPPVTGVFNASPFCVQNPGNPLCSGTRGAGINPPFPRRPPADPKWAFEPTKCAGAPLPGGGTDPFVADPNCVDTQPLQELKVDPTVGGKIKLGYRFHPRLAVEGQFEMLDYFRVKVQQIVPETVMFPEGIESPRESYISDNDAIRLRPWVLTAGPKAYLLTGRFQPYVHVGAGYIRTKFNNREINRRFEKGDFALRFGGGFDFYATENAVVNIGASYVLPTGGLENLVDYFSVELLGLSYRF